MGKMFKASAVALICLAAVPATAMPIAPLKDAPSGLTLVAMGCGPGWTRGPYGNCHPMGYVAPGIYAHPYAYRPYAYGRRCWWRAGVRVCA